MPAAGKKTEVFRGDRPCGYNLKDDCHPENNLVLQ
jgi:hypothetical protein